MIVPSVDLRGGRAVQLRQGRDLLMDGGDPWAWLERFSVAGEVAVIDLDAAMGQGDNAELIRRMVRRYRCRIGGGIRSVEGARDWLDAGAAKVIVGTAASPELCGELPRARVIAAVDSFDGKEVVEGWRRRSGRNAVERVRELAPYVGGFLATQVEREGGLGGIDLDVVRAVVAAAGEARVTAAGGVTEAAEIAALDRLGADAQVGAALYTGRLDLGDAVAAPLRGEEPWPTVVCDALGRALGLVWSRRETIRRAIDERRGIYWSRSRGEIWEKGATSGNTQELIRVALDCDRDALRFEVRQAGAGFCHRGTRSCWGEDFDLGTLFRTLEARREEPAAGGSGTARLLAEPDLLRSKLVEEARELAAAEGREESVHETADLVYMALVALARGGGELADVVSELERRSGRARRRPMEAKS